MSNAVKIRLEDGFVLEGITSFPFVVNAIELGETLFEGDYTYAIEVEHTPGNLKALKFHHLNEINVDFGTKYPCSVEYGAGFIESRFQILEVKGDFTSINVSLNYGEKLADLNSKSIKKGLFGGPMNVSFNHTYEQTFFDNATIDDYKNVANAAKYKAYVKQVTNLAATYNEGFLGEDIFSNLICFPFFIDFQSPASTFFDARPEPNWVRRNNFSIRITNDFLAPGGYETNGWIASGLPGFSALKPIGLQPCIQIKKLVEYVLLYHGLRLIGNFFDYPFMDRLIHIPEQEFIKKTFYDEATAISFEGLGHYSRWELYPQSFKIQDFVPDMTISAMLTYLRNTFGLKISIDFLKSEVDLSFFKDEILSDNFEDRTDTYTSYAGRKDNAFGGFNLYYDKSSEKMFQTEGNFNTPSYFDRTPNPDDFVFQGSVTSLPPLSLSFTGYSVLTEDQKKSYWYRSDLKKFFYISNVYGQAVYTVANFIDGKKHNKGGFERECILPGFTTTVWNGFESQVAMVGPVASMGQGHNKFRIAHYTGRVHSTNLETSLGYYSANSIGRRNQQFEYIDGRENAVWNPRNRLGCSFYKQYEDFPDYSLFQLTSEGNTFLQANVPGLFELFQKDLMLMYSTSDQIRLKHRFSISEIYKINFGRKQRVGNAFFFFPKVNGNVPLTTEVEVEALLYRDQSDVEILDYPLPKLIEPTKTSSSVGAGSSSSSSSGSSVGAPGRGIATTNYNDATGVLTITYTDGSSYLTGDIRGRDGDIGNGIADTNYNVNTGVLQIEFTNGSVFDTGDLRGTPGSFSPLASRYLKNVTTFNVTGRTDNNMVASIPIPANTFIPGDSFCVLTRFETIPTFNGSATVRIYINTTNSLSGAILLGINTINNANLYLLMQRYFMVISSSRTVGISTNSSVNSDIAGSGFAHSSININWTIPQFFIVAIQPANIGQNINHLSTYITPVG